MDRLEHNQSLFMDEMKASNDRLVNVLADLIHTVKEVVPQLAKKRVNSPNKRLELPGSDMAVVDERPSAEAQIAVIMAIFTFGLCSKTVDIQLQSTTAVIKTATDEAFKKGRKSLGKQVAPKPVERIQIRIYVNFLKIFASKLCTGAKNVFNLPVSSHCFCILFDDVFVSVSEKGDIGYGEYVGVASVWQDVGFGMHCDEAILVRVFGRVPSSDCQQ